MSKIRISTLTLAAMVAASAAFPFAARADETKTAAAALKHRWTFNTDLKDSVTGRSAQKIGSSVAVADGVVKMTGAGNSTGSLNLGMDVMPPGAATVEIWAKQTAAKNYSRIFDYAQNTQNYLMEAWTAGTDINKSIVEVNRANTKYTANPAFGPLTLNTQFHITARVCPNADGSTTVLWATRNSTSGALVKSGSISVPNWAPASLKNPVFYLGHSPFANDHDAHAEYDEVRIWDGALTDAQLEANAVAGPDALPETVAVATAADNVWTHLRHRWSFNGNGSNGVPGGPNASWAGSCRWADSNTALEFYGNGYGKGYGNLGSSILPADSATIEIWATPTAARKDSRIFDCGTGENDCILLSWCRGTNVGQEYSQVKKNGTAHMSVNDAMGGFALNTKWHIAVSYRDLGNGDTLVRWTKRNADTGRIVRNRSEIARGWRLAEIAGATFFIGHSQYTSDYDAAAKYDEVRIWHGALTDAQLAENAKLGPDTLPSKVSVVENPRTVCVEEKTADSVTLAFGNPNGRAHALFLASGQADGGDDKYAWDSFEKVADISELQETYTYEVPAALRDGRPLRFFLLQTTGLNMAKELDFVHSTGAQWVNVELVPDGRTVTDFRFGNVTYVDSTAFFGQNWTGSRYLFNQQGNKFYFHAKGSAFGAKPALNTDYRFVVDDDNHVSLFTNGAETRVAPSNTRSVDGNNPFYVFACNDGTKGSTFDFRRMKVANGARYEPYHMQRDYIPALNADGVAGLYDQVHDSFHPSGTATALVAGNERPAAKFGRVTDMTPTFRFLPSVAVTEQTATTATLAFGNGADGSKLFLAYGATDGGADKNAWDSFEDLGAIAAGETSRTVTLPAALQATGLKYRFFLMKTDDLPYASEVASFTSSGGQTVRTGYIPDITTTFDFRISGLTYGNDTCLFGQGWNGANFLLAAQGNYYRWYGSGTNLDPAVNMSEATRVQLLDGPAVRMDRGDSHHEYGVYLTPNPILDFAVFGTWSVTRGSKYTFNSLLVKDAGMVVRDLVPVVKANGKGALFDRANGVLHSNEQESSDFTKGATLTRTGWVQDSTASLASFAAADAGRAATAVWTGAGDAANLADPANWRCYDATGAELPATAVPDSGTTAYIDGNAAFSFPVGSTGPWGSLVIGGATGRVTLTADCDWRGLGAANVAAGMIIDLNGHTLYVDDIAGDGSVKITDSVLERASLLVNGSFEEFDGVFVDNPNYSYFRVGSFQATGWDGTTGAGLTKKGTTWCANTPIDGLFACFLQRGSGWIAQTFTAPETGEYTLTFKLAARPNYTGEKMSVDLDGVPVRTWGAVNNTVFEEQTVTLDLTAGEHTLAFQGYNLVADTAALIDDVRLVKSGIAAGELHIDVAAGAAKDNVAYVVDGGLTLVKTGAGTFTAKNYLRNSGGTVVNAGTLAMGATSLVPNKYPIRVLDGATYDMAGNGNGNCPVLTIEGTGPDGKGALRNSGADVSNGSAQLAGIILTGDATAYSSNGSFGLINSGYAATEFDLAGHTLTVDVPAAKSFWLCNAVSSCEGLIRVTSGRLYFHNSAVNLPNVDMVVDGVDSKVEVPAVDVYLRDLVMDGGSTYKQSSNRLHLRNLTFNDATKIETSVSWIYIADTLLVSNETTDVTCAAPITGNGTYPRLVKKGAAKFNITNNHSDQRMDRGAEIFGGTVVMGSTHSSYKPEIAISAQAVPVKIHAGGTLDMRACEKPVKFTTLEVEAGGTILANAANVIQCSGDMTFTGAQPFTFEGTINCSGKASFDLTGAAAPEGDANITLLSAGTILGLEAADVEVAGAPAGYEVVVTTKGIFLTKDPSSVVVAPETKIWTLGGSYVYGSTYCFRAPLAQSLSAEGWNVKMTGWRTANANAVCAGVDAWKRHAGVQNLALKTSATRAGVLEGLETYAAAANEPDFTVFLCGDIDVVDGVADATVLANYKEAVTRIKAALPMTTVIACTIPGGSTALNGDIASWCASEADVECVDVSALITSSQTEAECAAVAAAIKAKLLTLATANGKNTPSTWTRPAVVLDATNNVPAAYLDGFTRVRTIEPTPTLGFAQNLYGIPYTYAPPMQETGIAKVGYYIELVRKDTGALQAMWIDMDAPGSTWADVALPVTHAQRKQQTVTKLHVWSNFGGVKQVAADDDSVEGYIEFNPVNYGGGDRTGDVLAEPWSGGICGFNDTLTETGDSGHGCFQLMRKYAEPDGVLPGEILFAYNRWGSTAANPRAIGMGTMADFGNLGHSSSKTLDWTFTYGADGSDTANISGNAYSTIKIEFWVKYDGSTPDRSVIADYVWTGATDSTFNTVGNWEKDGTAATSLANASILVPEGASPAFTYIGWDPISLTTTRLLVDGVASFNDVGGFYLSTLDVGATGRLTYDPTKFTFRLLSPPAFASGAKIALAPKYAQNTKGRFLLMTWNAGALDMDEATLTAVFDAASANGNNPKVWAENLEAGGRLWLDLDYGAAKQRVNVLPVGDSITHGGAYGNWRTGLMKKLAAAGYEPIAKGHRYDQSADICGAAMPDEWISHSGIGGQRLISGGGGGTIDAIENFLDQAGDVDFVLVKLGTNDINSGGRTPGELFPVWSNLVEKVITQKPTAKFIAGAVVDIADAAKNAKVVTYNTMMREAIEGGMFPAKRAYFADLYTPCYRYDQQGNYITGSFQSATDLHPDWPGEDKMADVYCKAITDALADDPGFTPGQAEANIPTTSGAENNVPAAFRAGFTCARVFDVAAHTGTPIASNGYVPYDDIGETGAAEENIGRVGYYIELKRKDDGVHQYHGLVRWLWVSMDAFGDRSIETVGIPIHNEKRYQGAAAHLKIASNMPGIETTPADGDGADGWLEFWPNSYSEGDSGIPGAPAQTYTYDWNDSRSNDAIGYGSMQVHRLTPGAANAAQTLFAFNRWGNQTDRYEIGLGNLSHQSLGSMDWTFSADTGKLGGSARMCAPAYEIAKIEIWTTPGTVDMTARWTGGGAAGNLADPANWECRDAAGNVVENAVPNEHTTVVIDGTTSFSVPEGTAMSWKGVQIGADLHKGAQMGYIKYPNRSAMGNDNWKDVPLKEYISQGVGDLTELTAYGVGWSVAYINEAHVRYDGWVYVSAAEAGTWNVNQRYDDYYGFAIDGAWKLLNRTYDANKMVNFAMTEGWHRFTIVCGDTTGGEGANGASYGMSYDGKAWPMLVSVNGAEYVPFTPEHFTMGTGRNVVTLDADCDWRGLGTVAIPSGSVIDLNGHTLRVRGLSADGYVGAKVTSSAKLDAAVTPPSVLSSAVMWFDASDASTMTLDAEGRVRTWTSKDANHLVATADGNYPIYDTATWGRPTVDFGKTGSQRDMIYTRQNGLRTVFWVVKIEKTQDAFLLGDKASGNYRFHRGTGGQYGNSSHAKFSNVWNGTTVVDWQNDVIPDEDFQVISVVTSVTDARSDSFTNDRNLSNGQRTGGRQLSELIAFNTVLTDAQRTEVVQYLQRKWMGEKTPGTLVIDTPEGVESANDGVAVCGNVKVVKEGAGAYVAPAGSTYTGGTEVRAGTFRLGAPKVPDAREQVCVGTLGAFGTDVTVEAGATLDACGTVNNYRNRVVLNGGTLANTLAISSAANYSHFGDVTLTADSYMDWVCGGLVRRDGTPVTLDLQGHTLHWNGRGQSASDWCWLLNTDVTAGTLSVDGFLTAYYLTDGTKGIRAPQTTLVVNRSGVLAIDREPVTVKDYIAANTSDGVLYSANSLTVSGVFKPESDRHWGCTLASGATLDLTGWVGPWNATSASGRAVIFPTTAGATVNVNLAGRTDLKEIKRTGKKCVVEWAAMPENTSFVLDNDTRMRGYRIQKTEDGLKLTYIGGTAIHIR